MDPPRALADFACPHGRCRPPAPFRRQPGLRPLRFAPTGRHAHPGHGRAPATVDA
ncbi:hypothetical protein P3T26_006857 [Streptomyces sp. MAA16]|nr:hypothetical protein [Streptomyces sp. MAA16]